MGFNGQMLIIILRLYILSRNDRVKDNKSFNSNKD